jgi:hypothetical protein
MSEEESFLARWSRRKRDASEGRAGEPPEASPRDAEETSPKPEPSAGEQPNRLADDAPGEPLIDLSKLPPIESITAETDIRAFLAPGVPADLTRAALRRAWSVDTSIRDFIGLVENDWDVLAPAAAAGVQPLTITDEMRRMVDALFSTGDEPADGAIAADRGGACPARATERPAAADHPQAVLTTSETESSAGRGAVASQAGCTESAGAEPLVSGPVEPTAPPPQEPQSASQQIDTAMQRAGEESRPSGVSGRPGHGRALPT